VSHVTLAQGVAGNKPTPIEPEANRNLVPETEDVILKSLERLNHPPNIESKALIANHMHAKAAKKCCRMKSSSVVTPTSGANDEVERRGAAATANEADLSGSSTSLLGPTKTRLPRSIQPIVRRAVYGEICAGLQLARSSKAQKW